MRNSFILVCVLAFTASPTWADTSRSATDSLSSAKSSRVNTSNVPTAVLSGSVTLNEENVKPEQIASAARGTLTCRVASADAAEQPTLGWEVLLRGDKWWTCLADEGNACCWPGHATPPNFRDGKGARCAAFLCEQKIEKAEAEAAANADVDPAVSRVEMCADKVITDENGEISDLLLMLADRHPKAAQGRCHQCCTASQGSDAFTAECRTHCDDVYGAGVSPGTAFAQDQCVDASIVQFFGRTYFDGRACNSCCRTGAFIGAYPEYDANACVNACRQAAAL